MFNRSNTLVKIGRPPKNRGINLTDISTENDDYIKTVVVHVRVSEEEKKYLQQKVRSQSCNISSYIRRLIFDVYLEKLRSKKDLIEFINGKGVYPYQDYRTEYIHIRFTEREKYEVLKLSKQYHRDISDFIRWVAIQLPIDEMIQNF